MTTDTVPRPILDAAHRLKISRSKVYELLAAGELASVRIGRTRRIAMSALAEFIESHAEHDTATIPR